MAGAVLHVMLLFAVAREAPAAPREPPDPSQDVLLAVAAGAGVGLAVAIPGVVLGGGAAVGWGVVSGMGATQSLAGGLVLAALAPAVGLVVAAPWLGAAVLAGGLVTWKRAGDSLPALVSGGVNVGLTLVGMVAGTLLHEVGVFSFLGLVVLGWCAPWVCTGAVDACCVRCCGPSGATGAPASPPPLQSVRPPASAWPTVIGACAAWTLAWCVPMGLCTLAAQVVAPAAGLGTTAARDALDDGDDRKVRSRATDVDDEDPEEEEPRRRRPRRTRR